MAKQGSPNTNIITTITDLHDNIIVEVRQDEYLVIEKDGSITSYSNSRSIQLVDGSTWNPDMLRSKPPIYIGVCEICRDPGFSFFRKQHKTHGLVAMSRAKLCECGILCCPRHRVLCSDKRWRCHRCAKKFRLISILKPLFFERMED